MAEVSGGWRFDSGSRRRREPIPASSPGTALLPTPRILPATLPLPRSRPQRVSSPSGTFGYVLFLLATGTTLAVTIYYFNRFVSFEQQINTARAQIDRELQRRTDLIHNLVPSVFAYADLERSVFTQVARVRSERGGVPQPPPDLAAPPPSDELPSLPEGEGLGDLLGRLIAVSEQYPDMKASAPFELLMQKVAESEDRLALERQKYNDLVNGYRTLASSFPGAAFATVFGFDRTKPLFTVAPGDGSNPLVRRPSSAP